MVGGAAVGVVMAIMAAMAADGAEVAGAMGVVGVEGGAMEGAGDIRPIMATGLVGGILVIMVPAMAITAGEVSSTFNVFFF